MIRRDQNLRHILYWFNGTIVLALMPPAQGESAWIYIMDAYSPDNTDSTAFNAYLVENYVDRELHRFPIALWNVNTLVEEKPS